MSDNRITGRVSHETKLRLLTSVRSLAIQGVRIETHVRKTRLAQFSRQAGADIATKNCGCSKGDDTPSTVPANAPRATDEHSPVPAHSCMALDLLQSARLAKRAMRKAQANARLILTAAEGIAFMQEPKAWNREIKAFAASPKYVADTRKLLAKYGFNIDVAQYVIDELVKLDAPPKLAKDLKALKLYQKAQDGKIGRSSSALDSDQVSRAIDEAPIEVSFVDGRPVVSVRCERLPSPVDVGCYIVVIGVFIVVGIIILAHWLEDLFNGTDDDQARDLINSSTCSQLSALSIEVRRQMLQAMIDGPTGDDDENAIARLLECSTCEDVSTLVSQVGGVDGLLAEFQGSEWDRLMLRLQQCGLVDFTDWDDDVTRQFINRSDCATLNALGLTDIRHLILNMFAGSTGDDDENAIIRLINCLPCERRRELMRMSGMSYDDFDDEVDGSEWDRLDGLLSC